MSTTLHSRTYLPAGKSALDRIDEQLTADPEARCALVGPGGTHIALPAEMHDILVQVVDAMRQGKAVTVSPSERQLTTQEAADLLGISRPTVVKLIENGTLPAQRVSTRRKLALSDVLAYGERRRRAQLDAIAATSVGLDGDEQVDDEILAAARRRAADRRRARIDARREARRSAG